jgi:sulfate permease, SulP family
MVVTTTTAAALAVGSAVSGFTGADGPETLFVLSALAGVMMIAAACCAGVASHGLSRSQC